MNRRAHGLRAWLWQRLSAVYMLIYLLYAGAHLALYPPRSFLEWRAWMSDPLIGLVTALFFSALLIHAWVGMRDVIIDYVGALIPRILLLTLVGLVLAGSGLWVSKALFSPGG